MALCGKLTLALGLAMVGVDRRPYIARAQQSYCCTYGNGLCDDGSPVDCPPTPDCPGGCWRMNISYCCYRTQEVVCNECLCDSVYCHCGYLTGNPC